MRRVGFVDVVDARMLVFWRFLVFMVFFDLMIRGEPKGQRRDGECWYWYCECDGSKGGYIGKDLGIDKICGCFFLRFWRNIQVFRGIETSRLERRAVGF